MKNFQEKVGFIWSVADLLRGDYKQSEYGNVILPLTVLRRLDCVLEPMKAKVLERAKALPRKADETMKDLMLCQAAGPGMTFYNTSRFVLQPTEAAKGKGYVSLLSDQEQIGANLTNYIAGFSANAREIFLDKFKLSDQIGRLDEANLLYLVLSKFTEIEPHPDVVGNVEMGYIFEELIRRFSEASNETAGEHFTPREVIRLMVTPDRIDFLFSSKLTLTRCRWSWVLQGMSARLVTRGLGDWKSRSSRSRIWSLRNRFWRKATRCRDGTGREFRK
jgi:type I restriction enzyme M protein